MVHVLPGREGRIAKYRTELISASNARNKMPIRRKLMPSPHTGRGTIERAVRRLSPLPGGIFGA